MCKSKKVMRKENLVLCYAYVFVPYHILSFSFLQKNVFILAHQKNVFKISTRLCMIGTGWRKAIQD